MSTQIFVTNCPVISTTFQPSAHLLEGTAISIRYWLGGRVGRRAQTVTIAITGFDASTVYSVTIGGSVVSATGITSTAATATALQAALAASLFEEFREITWSVNSSTISGVANEAGRPFVAVSSVAGGAGTIGVVTTTVTNKSPNDGSDAANWSAATLPISGDSIVFERSDVSMLYGLTFLAAVDIVLCTVRDSFTGAIGLPPMNSSGYYEYRQQSFAMQTCTTLYEEQSSSLSAGDRRYSVGANACTATIIGQGGGTIGEEVTWLDGTSTSNAVEVQGGSVALSSLASEASALASLLAVKDSVVRAGSACTFSTATVKITDSVFEARTAITTLTEDGASLMTLWNAMTVGTLTILGGSSCVYNSSGTITTMNLTGSIDFSQDSTAVAITNPIEMFAGASLNDPDGRISSLVYDLNRCRMADVTVEAGNNRRVTIS